MGAYLSVQRRAPQTEKYPQLGAYLVSICRTAAATCLSITPESPVQATEEIS
jgi:hypothetical protein